jgi:hypothetical protein
MSGFFNQCRVGWGLMCMGVELHTSISERLQEYCWRGLGSLVRTPEFTPPQYKPLSGGGLISILIYF